MEALAVVEAFNVADDGHSCSLTCREGLAVDEFVFQGREEAFCACVVVAVAEAAHAGKKAVLDHQSEQRGQRETTGSGWTTPDFSDTTKRGRKLGSESTFLIPHNAAKTGENCKTKGPE